MEIFVWKTELKKIVIGLQMQTNIEISISLCFVVGPSKVIGDIRAFVEIEIMYINRILMRLICDMVCYIK